MSSEKTISEFQQMKKVIISCVSGSALEWYDFAIYSFFAQIIGKLFFPSSDGFQSLIASFGAFASGLIARPLGSVLFGYIGDVWGRKKALVISIYLMAIPTALMGFIPTYEQIGSLSGIILTLIRIAQGLALGGGFTGTIVFLYEHSSRKRKATFSSWAPFSLVSGFVLGAVVATLISNVLTTEQLESFGWRIPFILSFFGTFIAKYVREKLQDPQEFLNQDQNAKKKESLFGNLLNNHWKSLILVIFTDFLTASGYFLISIFLTTYFDTMLKLGHKTAFLIQTINMLFLSLLILFGGWCADRLGRRRQMLISCLLLAILAYPLFLLMSQGTFLSVLFGELGIVFLFAMYYGPIPATICSMFPTNVRLVGVSIAHNVAMAAFGAYAPTLATYTLKWTGNLASPAILFIISALITSVALFVWKEKLHLALHEAPLASES